MKKISKIIVILLIVLIVLGGGTFAYFYFATDMLKSDRELFFKYTSKNLEIIDMFKDETLSQYYTKKLNTPYENKGQYKVTGIEEYLPEKAKDMEIVFNGQIDKANNYAYEQIKVNYNENTSMGIDLVNNKDYYGIKFEEIIKKYLTLENNNIKEFGKKLGATNLEDIPDKIDFNTLKHDAKFNEEEMDEINKILKDTLESNITDEMITSSKVEDSNIYTLDLSGAQAKNILNDLLKNLMSNELILNKIKEIYKTQNNVSDEEANKYVEDAKEKINKNINIEDNKEFEEINISVSAYVQNRKLVKTELNLSSTDEEEKKSKVILNNGENKAKIEIQSFKDSEYIPLFYVELKKDKTSDELAYDLNINTQDVIEINLLAKWTGLSTLENINEQYSVEFSEEQNKVKYIVTNQNTFVQSINSKVSEDEFMILNNYNEEQLQKIIGKLQSTFEQLNKVKMEQIGVSEDENPIIYFIPFISIINQSNTLEMAQESNYNHQIESAREQINLEYASYKTNLIQEQMATNEQISVREYLIKNWTESSDSSLYTIKDGVVTLAVPDKDGNYITGTFDESGNLVWSDEDKKDDL